MALDMRSVDFEGDVPTLEAIVARAEALGGLAVRSDGTRVWFADVPDDAVTVFSMGDPNGVALTDYSQSAPTLMDLIEHALVALGGRPRFEHPLEPLPTPLTLEHVRIERRRYHRIAAFGTALVAGYYLLVLALPVALLAALYFGLRRLAG
jgi:hypothetical protein